MPDPIITRDPTRFTEIYTGGTITGVRSTVVFRHGTERITVQTDWDMPEADQMDAEMWTAQKATVGPTLVDRAAEETNLEYKAFSALRTYIDGLPAS